MNYIATDRFAEIVIFSGAEIIAKSGLATSCVFVKLSNSFATEEGLWMVEIEEFAHGYHYGDYSGIVFYGPPIDGSWRDRLAISDCYIDPMFYEESQFVERAGKVDLQ